MERGTNNLVSRATWPRQKSESKKVSGRSFNGMETCWIGFKGLLVMVWLSLVGLLECIVLIGLF